MQTFDCDILSLSPPIHLCTRAYVLAAHCERHRAEVGRLAILSGQRSSRVLFEHDASNAHRTRVCERPQSADFSIAQRSLIFAFRLAPKNIFNIRKSARSPNKPVDTTAILNNCERAASFRFKTFFALSDFSRELADILRSARVIKTRSKERNTLPAEAAALLTQIHRTHNIAPTPAATGGAAVATANN